MRAIIIKQFGGLDGLVQCIIDLVSVNLLSLLGVSKTVEIGAA